MKFYDAGFVLFFIFMVIAEKERSAPYTKPEPVKSEDIGPQAPVQSNAPIEPPEPKEKMVDQMKRIIKTWQAEIKKQQARQKAAQEKAEMQKKLKQSMEERQKFLEKVHKHGIHIQKKELKPVNKEPIGAAGK